jgi:hypothetical protein
VQALATSSSVMPRARRTSRIRVIMMRSTEPKRLFSCPTAWLQWQEVPRVIRGRHGLNNRLLAERSIGGEQSEARDGKGRPRRTGRSVTVNLAESPLGWLRSRGHVDARQCAAGARLRADWEKAQLGPRVTMRWGRAAAGPWLSRRAARLRSRYRGPVRQDAVRSGGGGGRPGTGRHIVARGVRGRGHAGRGKPRSAGRRARASWCWGWRWTGSPTSIGCRDKGPGLRSRQGSQHWYLCDLRPGTRRFSPLSRSSPGCAPRSPQAASLAPD